MVAVQGGGDDLVAQLVKLRERGRRAVEATVQLASVAGAQGRGELAEQLYAEAMKEAPAQSSSGRSVRWNYGWDLLRRASQRRRWNSGWPRPPMRVPSRAGCRRPMRWHCGGWGRSRRRCSGMRLRYAPSRRSGIPRPTMRSCCRSGARMSVRRWPKCSRPGRPHRLPGPEGGVRPGCTRHSQRQQPKQQQQRAIRGMAGRCGLAGHAVNPRPAQPLAAVRSGACEAVLRKQSALTHVSSVAACSCALSCAHGKTGVGRPAQPARGMPRAHGANGPANPHRPASESSLLLVGVDLGRHGRSTPCVDESASESNTGNLIEEQPSVGSALQKAASQPVLLLLLLFFFLLRG